MTQTRVAERAADSTTTVTSEVVRVKAHAEFVITAGDQPPVQITEEAARELLAQLAAQLDVELVNQ